MCLVESPLTLEYLNTAHTSSVDDLMTTFVTANNLEVHPEQKSLNPHLGTAFAKYNLKPNQRKQ
eukprot:3905725-Karenia_brevis.AAC.1